MSHDLAAAKTGFKKKTTTTWALDNYLLAFQLIPDSLATESGCFKDNKAACSQLDAAVICASLFPAWA